MEKTNNPIYERDTLELVTVAIEYCNLLGAEAVASEGFVDKATKLLPLLYLKAALLPDVAEEMAEEEAYEYEYADLAEYVTEEMYEDVRERLAASLGEQDSYLETFHADMPYSDAPIAAFISEDLADVYQDLGNFIARFRTANEAVMRAAIARCRANFQTYWGQRLLNALKALHAVRYA